MWVADCGSSWTGPPPLLAFSPTFSVHSFVLDDDLPWRIDFPGLPEPFAPLQHIHLPSYHPIRDFGSGLLIPFTTSPLSLFSSSGERYITFSPPAARDQQPRQPRSLSSVIDSTIWKQKKARTARRHGEITCSRYSVHCRSSSNGHHHGHSLDFHFQQPSEPRRQDSPLGLDSPKGLCRDRTGQHLREALHVHRLQNRTHGSNRVGPPPP